MTFKDGRKAKDKNNLKVVIIQRKENSWIWI